MRRKLKQTDPAVTQIELMKILRELLSNGVLKSGHTGSGEPIFQLFSITGNFTSQLLNTTIVKII